MAFVTGHMGASGIGGDRSQRGPVFNLGGNLKGVNQIPDTETKLDADDLNLIQSIANMDETRAAMRELLVEVVTRPQFSESRQGREVPLQMTHKFDRIMRAYNEPALRDMYETYFNFGLVVYTRALVRTPMGEYVNRVLVPREKFVITTRLHRGVQTFYFYWENQEIKGARPFPDIPERYVFDTSVVVAAIDSTAPTSDGHFHSIMFDLAKKYQRLDLAESLQEAAAIIAASSSFALEHTPVPANTFLTTAEFQSALPLAVGTVADPAQGEDATVSRQVTQTEFVTHLKAMYEANMNTQVVQTARERLKTLDPKDEVGKKATERLMRGVRLMNTLRSEASESTLGTMTCLPSEWRATTLPPPVVLMDVEKIREELVLAIRHAFGLDARSSSEGVGRAAALSEVVHRDIALRDQRVTNLRDAIAPYFLHAVKATLADLQSADERYALAIVHAFANGSGNIPLRDPSEKVRFGMLTSIRDMFKAEEDDALGQLLDASPDDLFRLIVSNDKALASLVNSGSTKKKKENPQVEAGREAASRVAETIDLFQTRVWDAVEKMRRGELKKPARIPPASFKGKIFRPGKEFRDALPRDQQETTSSSSSSRSSRGEDEEAPRPGTLLRALAGSRKYNKLGVVSGTPGVGKQLLRIAQHMLAMARLSNLSISFTTDPDTRMKVMTNVAAGVMTVDDARRKIATSHGGDVANMPPGYKVNVSDFVNNMLYIESMGKNGILTLPGEEKVFTQGQPDPEPMDLVQPQAQDQASSSPGPSSKSQDAKDDRNKTEKTTSKSDKSNDTRKRKREGKQVEEKEEPRRSGRKKSKPNRGE